MGDYASFFEKGTGFSVFPYQRKLGEEPVRSRLIHVPTGAGKTAAAIVAWLWRPSQGANRPGSGAA
jgi:CRISPR-associated endonuclease/helicase Cas3